MKLTVQQPTAREIKVKLLLAGGQSAALVVPPEHPVLAQLLAAVAGVDGGMKASHPAVFQIPMEGGRASLAFAANQLVGVVTDPAVLIHSDTAGADDVAAEVPTAPVPAAAVASAAQGHGDLIRHPVVQIDSFLSGSEVAWLMELVFAAESQFVPSRVSDNKDDYRQSFMLSAP